MTSKERREKAQFDLLAFMKIDSKLREEEVVFDGAKQWDSEYIAKQLCDGKKSELDIGAINMTPIKEAFISVKKKSETYIS